MVPQSFLHGGDWNTGDRMGLGIVVFGIVMFAMDRESLGIMLIIVGIVLTMLEN